MRAKMPAPPQPVWWVETGVAGAQGSGRTIAGRDCIGSAARLLRARHVMAIGIRPVQTENGSDDQDARGQGAGGDAEEGP